MAQAFTHEDYTVGWVCALQEGLGVSTTMLDETHSALPKHISDTNIYALGRVGNHYVAMACLPDAQKRIGSAAIVAMQMIRSFPKIRFCILVGLAGAAPSEHNDVRLGDVVIGKPNGNSGGVVQYTFGQYTYYGYKEFDYCGALNAPPPALFTALSTLEAKHTQSPHSFVKFISASMQNPPRYPGIQEDRLFEADYVHVSDEDCQKCDQNKLMSRPDRDSQQPFAHYGTIATGDHILKDGKTRDKLSKWVKALCFDMEATGLMNSFPCVVIRGICDYSDSHKNNRWKPYATAAAAAYAKELLSVVTRRQVIRTSIITAAPYSVLVFGNRLLHFGAASLGRVVIDTQMPWQDYYSAIPKLNSSDYVVTNEPKMLAIIQNSERLTQLFSSITDVSLESRPSLPEKAYTLLNPRTYLLRLCGDQSFRRWLETTIKYGWTSYLIVGIYTAQISPSVVGPGNGNGTSMPTAPQEKILAIRYRKISTNWYVPESLDEVYLRLSNVWTVSPILCRCPDVEEIIEVDLQDACTTEDVGTKEVFIEGSELVSVVELGKNDPITTTP